jgi:hypothetical protein
MYRSTYYVDKTTDTFFREHVQFGEPLALVFYERI